MTGDSASVLLITLLVAIAGLLAACTAASGGEPASEESPTATIAGTGHDPDHDHTAEPAPIRLREWTGSTPPQITLSVAGADEPRPVLAIEAPGFTFTPSSVHDPVPGEGHAHLYLDGDLLTMIYKPTHRLPLVEPGAHELMVTLSTNDHLEYAAGGEPIAGITTIEIPSSTRTDDDPGPQTEPEVVEIVLTIAGGRLQEHLHRVPVPLGTKIRLSISSDVADELRINGYAIAHTITRDEPTQVEFTANIAGVFDIELENIGDHLIQLEVG